MAKDRVVSSLSDQAPSSVRALRTVVLLAKLPNTSALKNSRCKAKLLVIYLNPYVNMQLLHRRRSAGGVRKDKTKPVLNLKSSSHHFYWRCWDAAFLKNSTERSFQNEVVNGAKRIPPSFGFFT